jgi:hypothetical protein
MSTFNNFLGLSVLLPVLATSYTLCPPNLQFPLLNIIFVGVVGYFVTILLIPSIKEMTGKKGLGGKDLNKGIAGSTTLM